MEDCAIPLGHPGSTITVTIPHLSSARIWFSVDNKLTFLLNKGVGALVNPSVTNFTDPNINVNWAFAELTYNSFQLFANVSYVDFLALPMALSLESQSGSVQKVLGMPPDALNTAASRLTGQDNRDHAGWSKLIQRSPSGHPLRVISPNLGCVVDPTFQQNYWTDYVNKVYDKYSHEPLTVNTQGRLGNLSGQVTGGEFNFSGERFGKPSARDIYSCNSGPFVVTNEIRAGIVPRLAAAFNRSTILIDHTIPDSSPPFYNTVPTNHYSRIIHEIELDKRGYAFPYDDVNGTGEPDHSGSVSAPDPKVFTVTVGGH
jgi:hypothetical protein